MGDERRAQNRWWLGRPFLSLAVFQSLWSLFWWAAVDPRVVDVPPALRLGLWACGLVLLAGASRRGQVLWFDPLATWNPRGRYASTPRAQTSRQAMVAGAFVLGTVGPWVLTSTTMSLGIYFALSAQNTVIRSTEPADRGSVTRFQDVVRAMGGDTELVRVDREGTAWVTVWDRPRPPAVRPDLPPPRNEGNAACVSMRANGASRVSDGACPDG